MLEYSYFWSHKRKVVYLCYSTLNNVSLLIIQILQCILKKFFFKFKCWKPDHLHVCSLLAVPQFFCRSLQPVPASQRVCLSVHVTTHWEVRGTTAPTASCQLQWPTGRSTSKYVRVPHVQLVTSHSSAEPRYQSTTGITQGAIVWDNWWGVVSFPWLTQFFSPPMNAGRCRSQWT